MRQQVGFLQHQGAHLAKVADGRFVLEFRQRFPRRAIAQFGLVAKREQCLGAAGRFAGAGDGQHVLGRKIGGMVGPGRSANVQ